MSDQEKCGKVLVTGITGFVGSALAGKLGSRGIEYLGSSRTTLDSERHIHLSTLPYRDPSWREMLRGVDVVVHAAARVHIMSDDALDPLAEFRRANVDGTVDLAEQAIAAGVRRFIFLSSVKVNGESTEPGCFFAADDCPFPLGPYAISKFEAENKLNSLAAESALEVVNIRSPLVYGPGVKANFQSLLSLLEARIPLPLASIYNLRSLISTENLADLIIACAHHPAAANKTLMAADGEDISTPDLLRKLGKAMGRPARLLAVPVPVLELGAKWVGKSDLVQRLCGSLQVDIGKTRELLGWNPPQSLDEGLEKTAIAYQQKRGAR